MTWERLTPPGSARAYPLIYHHDPENTHAQHLIREDKAIGKSLCLTDPELDAMATKSEAFAHLQNQVRVLVDTLYLVKHLLNDRIAQDAGLGRDRRMESMRDSVTAVLVPFKVTPDA